jgi:hypothetical protein
MRVMKRSHLAALVAVLLVASAPATAATLPATPATFAAVLAKAQPGDIVQLADGFYGDALIRRPGVAFTGGRGAVFSSVNVTAPAGNNVFDGFTCAMTFVDGKTVTSTPCLRAVSVPNVTFHNLAVTCAIATIGIQPSAAALLPGGNVIGYPTGVGIMAQATPGSVIDGNDVGQCMRGITITAATSVKVTNNHVHDTRGAQIDGSVISDVEISRNDLHDANPWRWGAGDHGDYIHVWTNVGDAAPAANIVISANRFEQGQGTALLGVLVEDNSGQGYSNLKVDYNLGILANNQGISIEHATGEVVGNVLLGTGGDPIHDTPSIIVRAPSTMKITGNLSGDSQKLFATNPGNMMVPAKPFPAVAR